MNVPIQTLGCKYTGCGFQTGDHVPGALGLEMRCIFMSCTYAANDELTGTKEKLLFILESDRIAE